LPYAEKGFEIPQYRNSDNLCPAISSVEIWKTTSNYASDFVDSTNVIASLSSNRYYARLTDETVVSSNDFLVKIRAGVKHVTISGLKLVIAECESDTITSAVATVMTQTFLLGASDMKFKIGKYTNTDSQCPPVDKVAIMGNN